MQYTRDIENLGTTKEESYSQVFRSTLRRKKTINAKQSNNQWENVPK